MPFRFECYRCRRLLHIVNDIGVGQVAFCPSCWSIHGSQQSQRYEELRLLLSKGTEELKKTNKDQDAKIQQFKLLIAKQEATIEQQQKTIKELQQFKDAKIKLESQKKALDDGLLKQFEQLKISDQTIEILLKEGLASNEMLSELSKEDLKEMGLKIKDIISIQKMFK